MSGPKSGIWYVVPTGQAFSFEDAKAILRQKLDQIREVHNQLELLLHKKIELPINTGVDDIIESDLGGAQKISSELNNRFDLYIRLQDELEEIMSTVAMRERAAALVASIHQSNSFVELTTNQLKLHNNRVQKLLDSLNGRAPVESRDEIETLAKACIAAGNPSKAELLLADLRVRINQLNRSAREEQRRLTEQRDKDAAEARLLIQRLGVLGRTLKETIHKELLCVASGDTPFSDKLRNHVADTIADAEKNYAGVVLKEVLEQIGYEVQSDFETLFAHGGSNFFQRPSWGEYHCRITVDPKRQHLNFDMVRYGSEVPESMETALRDKEMEQKWCDDVPYLLNHLKENGLNVNLTRRLAPGTIALQVIDDSRLKPISRKRDKKILASLEKHY